MKIIREKEINRTNFSQSLAQGASHKGNHTTTSPPFPQINPGGTQPRSFSVRLLPVQSPQAGFLNHQKYDFL